MSEPRKTVAVDLDGVLADFSRGIVGHTAKLAQRLGGKVRERRSR